VKHRNILSLLVGLLLALPGAARAADPEVAALDMALLAMFYDQKELVVTPTRTAKPITQVAENIVVITAEEIRDMHARSLAEVLNRVTGIFVRFQGQDYGSMAEIVVQGAPTEQVLLLVDDIPWNPLSDGIARTSTVPVHTIERIEIIKGPASSAWGPALGGVINVITKSGPDAGFSGSLAVSFGKSGSHDLYTDLSGGGKGFRYYLFAGKQGSSGLEPRRQYGNDSVFTKFSFPAGGDSTLTFSAGYSSPEFHEGFLTHSFPFVANEPVPTFWAEARLDSRMSEALSFSLNAYHTDQDVAATVWSSDPLGNPTDLFFDNTENNKAYGLRGKLTWTTPHQTLVAGVDYRKGRLHNVEINGPLLQMMGEPARNEERAELEEWALYLNDTFVFGPWSITPGLRFDALETADDAWSPSLGVTYRLNTDTVLRAYAGRGFSAPPLGRFATGSSVLSARPDLKPESVTAVTIGAESALFELIRCKLTGFYLAQEDTLLYTPIPYRNGDDVETFGAEIDLETRPVWNLSLRLGASYADRSAENDPVNYITKVVNIGLVYDDRSLRAEIFGHYVRPDYEPGSFSNRDTRHYDDVILDAALTKRFAPRGGVRPEIFAAVHNLLSGDQYNVQTYENPGVWAEAGLRLTY